MNCHRIKLLITLALSLVVVAIVWSPAPADARSSASGFVSAVRPGVVMTGDPDIGQGVVPPPHPNQGKSSQVVTGGTIKSGPLDGWVFRVSRIWATLYLSIWR